MYFTEIVLKTLPFLGILLSLTGNDRTSETSDNAVVSTTARKSGVLDDLTEGVEEPLKSSATGSFVENCNLFTNETSLLCFRNLKGIPVVAVHNITGKKGVEKDLNLTLVRKNGQQLRETSSSQDNGSTFFTGRYAITGNIKYLLELSAGQKALLFLGYLLCFIWKYRRFVLSGLNKFAKCILPGKSSKKRLITDSETFLDTAIAPSEKTSLTMPENDKKLPGKTSTCCASAKDLQDEAFKPEERMHIITDMVDLEERKFQDLAGPDGQLLESDDKQGESGSTVGESSDDEFPDEFLVVGSKEGKHVLCVDNWEPIDPADSSSELHGVEKIGTTNLVRMKDWKHDDLVGDGNSRSTSPNHRHDVVPLQTNDSRRLDRLSTECQDTPTGSLEGHLTNHLQLKNWERDGLVGDGKSRVTSPNDKTSVLVHTVNDLATTSLSCEHQDTPSRNHEEESSSLVNMKEWERNGLVGDGKSRVTSPNDKTTVLVQTVNDSATVSLSNPEDDSSSLVKKKESEVANLGGESRFVSTVDKDDGETVLVQQKTSELNNLSEDLQDTVNEQLNRKVNDPAQTKEQKRDVDTNHGKNPSTSTGNFEEATTNLVQMKNWIVDNLLCENAEIGPSDTSVDGEVNQGKNTQMWDGALDNLPGENSNDDGPNNQIRRADEAANNLVQMKDQKFHALPKKDMDCDSEVDDEEDEFPDESFLVSNSDSKTRSFIPIKDIPPEDIVVYEDEDRFAEDVLLGNQGDVVVDGDGSENGNKSPENVCEDQDVLTDTDDNGQGDRRSVVMNSIHSHVMASLFFSGAFVLPCFIAAKVLK